MLFIWGAGAVFFFLLSVRIGYRLFKSYGKKIT